MPDLPDTYADTSAWKPLPVPTEAVNLICQIAPIRVSFKANPAGSMGFVLEVGKAVRLKAGDAAHIQPAGALGGAAVFEDFG